MSVAHVAVHAGSTSAGPVVVVTPNPAVDVTYTVAAQELGVTHRVERIARVAGGKGVNVARVLESLGVPTVQVLPLGGATGAWMQEALNADGLETRVTALSGATRSTVAVVDGIGHPTLYSEPGPSVADDEWAALVADLRDALLTASHLVISGSFPPGTPDTVIATLVGAGREAGVPVVVDVSGPELAAAAAAGATILKPNLEEALAATRTDDIDAAAAALSSSGADAVVISRGSAGLVGFAGGSRHDIPAVPAVTGNPTGAGDATTAALVAALRACLPLAEALRHAAAGGAAAVLEPVAGAIDLDAFHRFLDHPPHSDGATA